MTHLEDPRTPGLHEELLPVFEARSQVLHHFRHVGQRGEDDGPLREALHLLDPPNKGWGWLENAFKPPLASENSDFLLERSKKILKILVAEDS